MANFASVYRKIEQIVSQKRAGRLQTLLMLHSMLLFNACAFGEVADTESQSNLAKKNAAEASCSPGDFDFSLKPSATGEDMYDTIYGDGLYLEARANRLTEGTVPPTGTLEIRDVTNQKQLVGKMALPFFSIWDTRQYGFLATQSLLVPRALFDAEGERNRLVDGHRYLFTFTVCGDVKKEIQLTFHPISEKLDFDTSQTLLNGCQVDVNAAIKFALVANEISNDRQHFRARLTWLDGAPDGITFTDFYPNVDSRNQPAHLEISLADLGVPNGLRLKPHNLYEFSMLGTGLYTPIWPIRIVRFMPVEPGETPKCFKRNEASITAEAQNVTRSINEVTLVNFATNLPQINVEVRFENGSVFRKIIKSVNGVATLLKTDWPSAPTPQTYTIDAHAVDPADGGTLRTQVNLTLTEGYKVTLPVILK